MRLRETAARLAYSPRDFARAWAAGGYLSNFRGRGMEFAEVRRYIAGDDVRTIDWRVTARTGQPHTKLFQEERERPVLLVVDQSNSMRFGTRRAFKSVAAAEAAALLAWSATEKGDRVGGLVFADAVHHEIRPTRGRRGALRFLRGLVEVSNSDSTPDQPAWVEAIKRTQRIARPGTWVCILSDFDDVQNHPEIETTLTQLNRHCELALIQVFDPLEQELPPPGVYNFSDGDKSAALDSAQQDVRQQHRARFEARRAQLDRWRRRLGLKLIELSTAADPVRALHAGLRRSQITKAAS
jgi:uncharacterized protein (DUF58 family)